MLSSTGKKEKLTASKGSEIEVSSNEYDHSTGNIWYRAILEENLAISKRRKLAVRHLNPLANEEHSPPLITTVVHLLIRPLPPLDPSPEVDFEEGDMVDAAHRGGWWSGWVVKVLPSQQRFLVYLRFKPDVIEVERNDLRPHMVWKDEKWFRCEKRHLTKSEFSAGVNVEVKIKVEDFGCIWSPAIAIMENDEDGTLLVKYKSLSGGEDQWTKTSVPYFEITRVVICHRPIPKQTVECVLDTGRHTGLNLADVLEAEHHPEVMILYLSETGRREAYIGTTMCHTLSGEHVLIVQPMMETVEENPDGLEGWNGMMR